MSFQVYLAECKDKDDQVIVNTQWFTTEVIGKAFAGEEFQAQFTTLPDQPHYTLEELRDFFPQKIDTPRLLSLLDHMDLVHVMPDQRYLLPGKLPVSDEHIEWEVDEAHDVKGISIDCVSDIDIFNPNCFPSVQKKILDAYGDTSTTSRSAIKFAARSISVLVQLTKHKRAINIAVMCPDKKSTEACYNTLQQVVGVIQQELFERSQGTNVRINYISHYSMKKTKNLEDVATYTKEELLKAETEDGLIFQRDKPEKVTDVLFEGYDKMLLQEFGPSCRYEWLPIDTIRRCFGRLDRTNNWREDFRAVGKALGMPEHDIDQIAEDSKRQKESPTDNIIKTWCQRQKRKMTVGMLQKLLSRLSLVANEDAVEAVDEIIKRYAKKVNSFNLYIKQTNKKSKQNQNFSVIVLLNKKENKTTHRFFFIWYRNYCQFISSNTERMLCFLLYLLQENRNSDWPEFVISKFYSNETLCTVWKPRITYDILHSVVP